MLRRTWCNEEGKSWLKVTVTQGSEAEGTLWFVTDGNCWLSVADRSWVGFSSAVSEKVLMFAHFFTFLLEGASPVKRICRESLILNTTGSKWRKVHTGAGLRFSEYSNDIICLILEMNVKIIIAVS